MTVQHIVKFDVPLRIDVGECEPVTPGFGAGSGGLFEVCVCVDVQVRVFKQSRRWGAWLSREAWELEAPVDSCHVKVSKCKADVCGGPGRGARIYLGPESACDLRFIAFFQIHPFYNDGGTFPT